MTKRSAAPAVSNTVALRMDKSLALRTQHESGATSGSNAGSAPASAAASDVLAQSQNLWNSGNHDAAIDLLRDALALAEHAGPADTSASAVQLPLLRELTRMQLADARFAAVWELLTRLEPLLVRQPELWAIRANAAQRLGHHQDSVHAYLTALQARPTEQRWLLGAAVSLAALGQTSSAAEMAEKARSVGPVSKEVLNYLRQMNVFIRDQ
jgi:tetratricopeptide (TPR) repeat protein